MRGCTIYEGHNEGGAREAQFPGRRITMGAQNHYGGAESLWGGRITAGGRGKVHLLPKDLRFERGGPNLFLAPGYI